MVLLKIFGVKSKPNVSAAIIVSAQYHWTIKDKMIHEVFMPALSSTMTEGKIVAWQKSAGDKVEKS